MDVKKAFADPKLEETGVWVPYRDGSRLKLARIGNRNFTRVFELKTRPFRRNGREMRIDQDAQIRIFCETIAETVLLDWEGFTEDGNPLAYDRAKATNLLRTLTDFRNDVVELATAEDRFRAEAIEDAEKN